MSDYTEMARRALRTADVQFATKADEKRVVGVIAAFMKEVADERELEINRFYREAAREMQR